MLTVLMLLSASPDDGRMENLKAEADRIIADTKAKGGTWDEGAAAIYLAMRPRFGPANAWLFNERGRKLTALAKALDVARPEEDVGKLDAWADSVEAAKAALEKAGFSVTSEPGHTAGLGWRPRVFGRRLVVTDASRTTTAVPYAELRKEPAKPANPRRTLSVIPLQKLSARVDLMSRVQPAELLGGLEGAALFVMEPPQGGDVDDGKLLEAIRATLFPGAKAGERPGVTLKQTQSGGTADLELQP